MQTVQYVRVINGQRTFGHSVLLDKIDRTSGQFETDLGYAQTPKQPVYVPYYNPIDHTVPGYIDLVPSDEVLLQLYQAKGVINQLASRGVVSYVLHHGSVVATPVISAAVHGTAGNTGSHGSFAAASGGVANFTDSTANGFAAGDVGKFITISGSSHSVNNGTFRITANTSSSVDVVANSNAVTDAGPLTWSLLGGLNITGTTLVSLTPDHTYVILTNLSGVKQTLTDTAILAAGGIISSTSIDLPNSIVTGGPVAAGWTVEIQANSKLSNIFTVS